MIYGFLGGQGLVLAYTLYLAVASVLSWFTPAVSAPLLNVYWNTFAVGYTITIYGVSLWTHRAATHQAYKTPVWMKYLFAAGGAMAAQGYFRNWVSDHHEHHANAEVPCTGKDESQGCDPHTPKDGFWHAFWGWLVKAGAREEHPHWSNAEHVKTQVENQLSNPVLTPSQRRKLEEKLRDAEDRIVNRQVIRFYDRTMPLWLTLSLVVPGLVCWAVEGTLLAFIKGVAIAGFARMGAVNIATSLVNSYEHMPKFPGNYRHFAWTGDDSSNNWFIALFNPEGFHWWHHVFPRSANHGVYWYERMLDHSANLIWVLEKVGLAWDVHWTTVKQANALKAKIEAAGSA